MSTDLTQFNFHGDGVRVVTDEQGEPLFVLADILAALGLTRRPAAVAERLDDDVRQTYPIADAMGRVQQTLVVTEPGMYDVIVRSDSPQARPFRRWVTHEVLPAIRRTGTYAALTGPELMARALIEAQATLEASQQRVAELEPPARAWTALAAAEGDYSLRDAAQILSRDPDITIGQNRLARLLRSLRWIDSGGVPYQHHVDTGRIRSRARTYKHPRTGEEMTATPQVRVTGKGLAWLHEHLGGTAPLTEQPHLEVVS